MNSLYAWYWGPHLEDLWHCMHQDSFTAPSTVLTHVIHQISSYLFFGMSCCLPAKLEVRLWVMGRVTSGSLCCKGCSGNWLYLMKILVVLKLLLLVKLLLTVSLRPGGLHCQANHVPSCSPVHCRIRVEKEPDFLFCFVYCFSYAFLFLTMIRQ